MIIPFSELGRHDFSLSRIRIVKQTPLYRVLNCASRHVEGFLLILSGEGRYTFEGGSFELSRGSAVYLPLSSTHRFEILSERIEFYRIDFLVHIDGEFAQFSDRPLKLADSALYECFEAARELEAEFVTGNSAVIKNEKLCTVIRHLQMAKGDLGYGKLAPAIERLHSAIGENVDCKELAQACFLSVSHFYKLFHGSFGMSPLEYRAKILLRRATAMLDSGDVTVGEVAAELGFENASYFSRFFKKHTGKSPSELSKRSKRNNN